MSSDNTVLISDSPEGSNCMPGSTFFMPCSTLLKCFGEVLLLLKSNKWNGL